MPARDYPSKKGQWTMLTIICVFLALSGVFSLGIARAMGRVG